MIQHIALLVGILARHAQSRILARSLAVTENVAVLQKTANRPASSIVLQQHIASNNSAPLFSVGGGAGYAATINFAGTDLLLTIDTGSSDTWIATSNLQCVSYRGEPFPTSDCAFGPLYSGSFPHGPIPDSNFNVSYGSGEFVVGELGLMNITIANFSLQQEIALVDQAYWLGDNETSGLSGFAYRALTSSYIGDIPSADDPDTNLVEYSPIVQTAMTGGLFSMFSMAFERNTDGPAGYLALGGLPPVDHNDTFACTPILQTQLEEIGRSGLAYSFYTIQPDGFSLSGGLLDRYRVLYWKSFVSSNFPVIIDSGTTLNYLPFPLARRVNALFDPPAKFNSYIGLFETDCAAKAPSFSVRINGTDFAMDARDMVVSDQAGFDTDTGLCLTSIQPSGGPYILGDAFLKNVVAVFDIEAVEMKFAARSAD